MLKNLFLNLTCDQHNNPKLFLKNIVQILIVNNPVN